MPSSSACTVQAVKLSVCMNEVTTDYSCDFPRFNCFFQIESQNFKIKSQIELQYVESNLYISNRIDKMVQIAI